MSAARRVAAYDKVVAAALAEAHTRGVFLIARLQDRRDWALRAENGKLERVTSGRLLGLAVQVFTAAGHCGFASSDQLDPSEARQLVRRAAELAAAVAAAGGEASPIVHELRREAQLEWPCDARTLDATPQAERRSALLEAHRQALELADGFATVSSLGLTDDEWRIVRGDGTDLRFRLPRALVRHSFTAGGAGPRARAGCSVSGSDDRVLLDPDNVARLRCRAAQALRRAGDAAGAPPIRTGCYRVVLDHSMAKGLAHEAFGHASETDSAEGSILASNGRLWLGERLASSELSIVDGPLAGDYADQPVDANGQPRRTVEIVRAGLLHSGLGDLFSAGRAGSPVTGAARAESFRARPIPRMSNIRLVVEHFAPLEADSETLSPSEVRDHLEAAGLLAGPAPTLLLAGHRGGQVSRVEGDFVFTCAASYDLSDGASPRASATFSGRSLSALRSIVGAVGDLRLDVPGHCVKQGQRVPTSGGSHAFVVLEPHPEVTVGGA